MADDDEIARASLKRLQEEAPTRSKRHGLASYPRNDEFERRRKSAITRENTMRLRLENDVLRRALAVYEQRDKDRRPTMTGAEVQAAFTDLGRAMLACPVVLDLGSGFVADLRAVKAGGPHDDQRWYIELELGTVRLRRTE